MNIYKIQRHIGEQTTPAKSQRYNREKTTHTNNIMFNASCRPSYD